MAEGYATGFYLWGEGGTLKSYTVEETLKKLGRPYKLSNTRVTGRALFEVLRDYPDVVHIIEDAETLFADKNSFGVLRSALWGQVGKNGKQERLVVWHIGGRREEFFFSGGVIIIANCNLNDIPQLRALKTRMASVHYQPTNEEIAALMRKIASAGHWHGRYHLPPEDCLEVAREIVERSQRLQRNLDIRLLINAFNDRLQWANGAAETHWRDMLDTRIERLLAERTADQAKRAYTTFPKSASEQAGGEGRTNGTALVTDAVVERLRTSLQAVKDGDREQSTEAGRKWACERADGKELLRLEQAHRG